MVAPEDYYPEKSLENADNIRENAKNDAILTELEALFGQKIENMLNFEWSDWHLRSLAPSPLTHDQERNMYAIGSYRLFKRLGRGGYGVVFEAYDEEHQQFVALKIVLNSDAVDLMRFVNEVALLESLSHPNVVEILDKGKVVFGEGGLVCPFMVMPLYPERAFPDFDRKLLLVQDVLRFAEKMLVPILDALCSLHEKGIVHRDVKPGNVMVDREGSPKLIDFTFACKEKDDLNDSGEILGTPMYMAPEQALHPKDLRPESDLYGFSVMAMTLLTLQEPFSPELKPLEIVEHLVRIKKKPELEDQTRKLWEKALKQANVPQHLKQWFLRYSSPHANLREKGAAALQSFKKAIEKDWYALEHPHGSGCMAWFFWLKDVLAGV